MTTIPFFGLIYRKGYDNKAIGLISHLFTTEPIRSEVIPFDLTDYYEPEMGKGLLRVWCACREPFPPDKIVELKHKATGIEKELAQEGKRMVNIDPGYVDMKRVVLATHKDAAHRIYLKDGIYAEVTLIYHKKSFQPLPWTYPDYRFDAAIQFFNSLRRHVSHFR
ncbi:MAG TPA: DUF4416 family protein [bacterium (Candidatus Stahlbacteria)]|nr:DUF4416 family protein [Candidatus Stahlbacteria bacterium]